MRPAIFLALVWLGLGGCAPPKAPEMEADLAILDATVVDVAAGTSRAGVTVLVRGDRIAALVDDPPAELAPTTRVLDAAGRFLLPGLWDSHVHLANQKEPAIPAERQLALYLAHGVVGVRDMGGDWELLEELRAAVGSGRLVGPEIVAAGPFFDGGEPYNASFLSLETAEEAAAAVARQAERGVDFIKVQARLPRAAYFGVVEAAAAARLPVAGHVPAALGALEVSEAGQATIEHVSPILPGDGALFFACSGEERRLAAELAAIEVAPRATAAERSALRARRARLQADLLDSYDPERAAAIFGFLAANGTVVTPTLVWSRGYLPLDAADAPPAIAAAVIPAERLDGWREARLGYVEAAGEERLALNRRIAAEAGRLVGEMHAAGVPILAGTDSFDGYTIPGDSLHRELELLVEAGLEPAAALRAATLEPARLLGRLQAAGTIAAGKVADLVLLDEDPLESIGAVRRVAAVVRGGTLYTRDELDRLLAPAEAAP